MVVDPGLEQKEDPQHLEASPHLHWFQQLPGWSHRELVESRHLLLQPRVLITAHLLLWGMITCQGSFEPFTSQGPSLPPSPGAAQMAAEKLLPWG